MHLHMLYKQNYSSNQMKYPVESLTLRNEVSSTRHFVYSVCVKFYFLLPFLLCHHNLLTL